jgi:hypothetical protein
VYPILDTATVEGIGLKVAEAAEALLDGGGPHRAVPA